MKTYVLIVSTRFPKTHKRAGKLTYFPAKILATLCITHVPDRERKLHTIRGNYPLWEKRINEVNEGKAIISLRFWSDIPYRSKQIEFATLGKGGIGIQKLDNPNNFAFASIEGKMNHWEDVAKNDGLSFDDFCDWFNEKQPEPMAIIHFTNFRY